MKNELGIYVGEAPGYKRGHHIYWPYSHSTSVRAHCWPLDLTDEQYAHYYGRRQRMRDKTLPFAEVAGAVHDWKKSLQDDPEALARVLSSLPPDSSPLVDDELEEVEPEPDPDSDSDEVAEELEPEPLARRLRSRKGANYAETMESFLCDYGAWRYAHGSFSGAAKVTVSIALKSAERDRWIEAIIAEIFSLIDGGTLERVDRAVAGPHRIIHSTAQLKAKWRQDGTLDKLKCRLCGCGNELWGQIAETYSPTI